MIFGGTFSMSIINAASFLCDILFTLIYFHKKEQISRSTKILAGILLLLTGALYFPGLIPFFSNSWSRFLCRALLYTGYLLCIDTRPFLRACYAACFWTTICTLCHNAFLAPVTYPYFAGTAQFGLSAAANQLICAIILLSIKSICYTSICRIIPLEQVGNIGKIRMGILLIIAWISIVVKNSQIPLMDRSSDSIQELSVYIISLQIILLVLLVLLELYQRQLQEHMAIHYQNITANALLKQIQAKQENDQAIHILRHDLKNHLLTLHHFLQNSQIDSALQYVNEFLDQTTPAEIQIHTGHALMDGLLLEKLGIAQKHQIAVHVNLDFRKGSFIHDFDLCSIIGNLLDNALEACYQVDDLQERYLEICGGCSANCLLFHITNSRPIRTDTTDDLPLTTKADRLNHGFGLLNVQRVLKKYNANLTLSTNVLNCFEASVLIPLPEERND